MSDSLLMLLEMMEEALEEQALIAEANAGTAFERVIVEVAGGPPARKKDKIIKHSGLKLPQLAEKALQEMGVPPGSDEKARMHVKESEIKGEAKTDVVIGGKKISLKLPGPIQFASGEPPWTKDALNAAFQELLDNQEELIEKEMLEDITQAMITARQLLEDSAGRYYIADNYEQALRDKYKARKLSESEIDSEVTKALNKIAATPHRDWKQWNEEIKSKLNQALAKLLNNANFAPILIDEFLTGRRMFAETPNDIAEYLLSPSGFYSVKTLEDTKKLLNESFLKNVRAQARGKGRPYMTKAVAIRIDFNQNAYVKAAKQAALQSLACDQAVPKVDPEPVLKCSVEPEKLLSDFVEQEVDLSSKTMEET